MEHQHHQRRPHERAHQQVQRPERRGEQVEHHRRRDRDLQDGEREYQQRRLFEGGTAVRRYVPPSRRSIVPTFRRSVVPPYRHGDVRRQCQEPEREHPVGPVERGQRGRRGEQVPLQSGRPRQSRPAWKLATWAPKRITMKPSPASARTRRWIGGTSERRYVPSFRRSVVPSSVALSATTSSVASSNIALARWVMMTQGGRASFTVTAPSSTWTTRRTRARTAGRTRAGSRRCRTQATAATASTTRLTSAAAHRCPISIMVGRSRGGNHSPSHRGQWSPQPIPEPVMRTTPPRTMRPRARPTPVHARRRRRMGGWVLVTRDSWLGGRDARWG